ncbi:hypothetical protein C3Z09_20815 [Lelliottia aquatilis]|uniref:hypothetical protein n=1 Tax=Lelliottia aquatilis TaxID=2080838 RepID=UPI000CDE81E2|nr:hypothetical protein [Lelliottia aquatilis]POZ13922.1 hypothetical protein C3Z09_20815 [Lelliottia aquatilis]
MDLSEMTMTDDARSVIRAFSDAPVMTLQAVTTMTGQSEHTSRFIMEQLLLAGLAQEVHGRWSLTEAQGACLSDDIPLLKRRNDTR